ncbi:MAG: hypothetical protein II046_03415 [Clostridiales bacterium]|nr:hypothetical protein [Clostridiales bacterium]MBQ2155960.1 hypothetical protein [Clostridiales bacterium]MBQ5519475.1 hypothetical protein [Clostridiales bacterium]
MKKVKAMALVLAVAMISGVLAGCSKTTTIGTDKFTKVCEKLKLEEFELDGDSPDMDDLEDGIYAMADADYIEDNPEQLEDFLKQIRLDDVIDVDDVESFAFAAKCTGLEDAKDVVKDPEDIADLEVDGAVAFQMTLADAGYAEDVMEAIEDLLDEADVSTKSLSGKEFFSSKKEGYFRFHVDIAKLAKLVLENDDIEDYLGIYGKMKDIDIEDILSELKGDVAVTVEINGKNVFILLGGALNTKPTTLNSFAKSFGAACNPVSVPMNEKLIEEMIESAVDNYLSKLKSGAGF